MGWGRVARVTVLATLLGAVTTGTAAAAAPPAANAAFATAGVQVYPLDSVGAGCQTLGFCDGVAGDLADSAVPRYLSSRPGEAVLVQCQSAGLAKVVGFFSREEHVISGWADAGKLRLTGGSPVPACGALT